MNTVNADSPQDDKNVEQRQPHKLAHFFIHQPVFVLDLLSYLLRLGGKVSFGLLVEFEGAKILLDEVVEVVVVLFGRSQLVTRYEFSL